MSMKLVSWTQEKLFSVSIVMLWAWYFFLTFFSFISLICVQNWKWAKVLIADTNWSIIKIIRVNVFLWLILPLSLSLLSIHPHNPFNGIFSAFHTLQISALWIPLSITQNADAYLLPTLWFLPGRVHFVPMKPPISHPWLIPDHSLLKSILLRHQNCFLK